MISAKGIRCGRGGYTLDPAPGLGHCVELPCCAQPSLVHHTTIDILQLYSPASRPVDAGQKLTLSSSWNELRDYPVLGAFQTAVRWRMLLWTFRARNMANQRPGCQVGLATGNGYGSLVHRISSCG